MKYLEDARLARLTADLTGAGLRARVLHGRVEAYTTKRTAADKKTAVKVGLRYAREMALFNEAVEACRRKRELQATADPTEVDADEERAEAQQGLERKAERRRHGKPRSCSVDGVTFATNATVAEDAPAAAVAGTAALLAPLAEGVAVTDTRVPARKRGISLNGNKRRRATSFDVAACPSFESDGDAPVRARATKHWGNVGRVDAGTDDRGAHPLIPQPSLYQSFNRDGGERTTMVPRRLVTDLILTLNAAFPDYDFAAARVSDFCTLTPAEAMRRIDRRLGEFARTTERGGGFLPRLWGTLEDVVTGGTSQKCGSSTSTLKDCEVYSYAPSGRGEEEDPLEFLTRSLAASASSEEGGGDYGDSRGRAAGTQEEGTQEERFVFSPAQGRIVSKDDVASSDGGLDTSMAYSRPDPIASPPSSSVPPLVTLWSLNYFFVSRDKKRIVLFACVQTMNTPRSDGAVRDDEDGEDHDGYNENAPVFAEARRGDRRRRRQELAAGGSSDAESTSRLARAMPGDESVRSVRAEDTDGDEDAGVGDADEDEVYYGGQEFDTGRLRVPSWVA